MIPYRKIIGTLLIFLLLPAGALADKIYIVKPEQTLQSLRKAVSARQPHLKPEEVEALVNPGGVALDDLKKALAPAPVFHDRFGSYFQGRILEFKEGLHGDDWMNPVNHDQILFSAYGEKGMHQSRKPALISARMIFKAHHEVDTMADFSFLFSNRHELLGEPFGSPRHRESIYKLVDPDGDLELYKGSDAAVKGEVTEGRVSRYILYGPLSVQDFMKTAMYLTVNPRVTPFQGIHGALPGSKIGNIQPVPVGTLELLLAMVRARKYPGYEPGFGEKAKKAVGILCGLALADPALVQETRRSRTERGAQIGLGGYQVMLTVLERPVRPLLVETGNRHLPVKAEEVAAAAIEVIQSEPAFRYYLGAAFLDKDPVNADPAFGLSKDMKGSASRGIAHALFGLASGTGGWPRGHGLGPEAKRALLTLLLPSPEDDPETREYLETDRRHFRDMFYQGLTAEQSTMQTFAWNVFCEHGWGHPVDAAALAERAFIIATSDPESGLGGRMTALLVLIIQTAGSGDSGGRAAAAKIGVLVGKLRDLKKKGLAERKEILFLKAFDALSSQRMPCPAPGGEGAQISPVVTTTSEPARRGDLPPVAAAETSPPGTAGPVRPPPSGGRPDSDTSRATAPISATKTDQSAASQGPSVSTEKQASVKGGDGETASLPRKEKPKKRLNPAEELKRLLELEKRIDAGEKIRLFLRRYGTAGGEEIGRLEAGRDPELNDPPFKYIRTLKMFSRAGGQQFLKQEILRLENSLAGR
ncbi:MAG: hypothetical protein ABII06_10085 [Pseudomonadota bacterium]